MKTKKIKCYKCHEEIDINRERYCSLLSVSKGKVVNQDYWHAQCWVDWINEAVERKMKAAYTESISLISDIAKSKGLNLTSF